MVEADPQVFPQESTSRICLVNTFFSGCTGRKIASRIREQEYEQLYERLGVRFQNYTLLLSPDTSLIC